MYVVDTQVGGGKKGGSTGGTKNTNTKKTTTSSSSNPYQNIMKSPTLQTNYTSSAFGDAHMNIQRAQQIANDYVSNAATKAAAQNILNNGGLNATAGNGYRVNATAKKTLGDYSSNYDAMVAAYNANNGGGGSSGGSSGGSGGRSYIPIEQTKAYQDLLAYFEQQNHAAETSALEAISARLNAIKGQYSNALKDSDAEFQKLINQNEVNKYRSARAIREALANRGQLNSGLGRQEALSTDIKYGNTQANLLVERQKARNDINNLIIQAEAEAEADKANARNQFANALTQYKLQLGI